MKHIDTLVGDIYNLFDPNKAHVVDEDHLEHFANSLKHTLRTRFGSNENKKNLRMSNAGQCVRKLWYHTHEPEKAEPLEKHVLMKFLYGDVIEELILFLVREAGHEVRGEQDVLEVEGVKGHRDAVIDNVLVDVKSASSYSFQDFKAGRIHEVDKFGYADQLGLYHHASDDVDPDIAAFLVLDKQNGYLCVDKYAKRDIDYAKKIQNTKEVVNNPNCPPRPYEDEPYQKSGNRKLGIICSYCEYKAHCWPGLRAYSYSNKPVFLTHVAKAPKVPEMEIFNG